MLVNTEICSQKFNSNKYGCDERPIDKYRLHKDDLLIICWYIVLHSETIPLIAIYATQWLLYFLIKVYQQQPQPQSQPHLSVRNINTLC